MDILTQIGERLQTLFGEEANALAKETGFIKRERQLTGSNFVLSLVPGWLQEGDQSWEQLALLFTRTNATLTASALSQHFSQEAADFCEQMLLRLLQSRFQWEEVDLPLLQRWSEVIVEDSSVITLAPELAERWKGCGGSPGASKAAVKLFVRWDLRTGELQGPVLTDGKHSDKRSPLALDDLKVGGLYLADLGFFGVGRLAQIIGLSRQERRYVITRWQPQTALYTKNGHRIVLRGILPQQIGKSVEMSVQVGAKQRLPMRLVLMRVPEEVAQQRREHLRERAMDHGREPNEELLALAEWTIILTNVPPEMATVRDLLVLLRGRWQIERLFRLWKEDGLIDECRSKKKWRIVCEWYLKLMAMVIEHWIIQGSCWLEPERSVVKAAQVIRREAACLAAGLIEGRAVGEVRKIVKQIQGGCQLNTRGKRPTTAQLFLGAELEWVLT